MHGAHTNKPLVFFHFFKSHLDEIFFYPELKKSRVEEWTKTPNETSTIVIFAAHSTQLQSELARLNNSIRLYELYFAVLYTHRVCCLMYEYLKDLINEAHLRSRACVCDMP